jgi:hypothetical protein
VITREQAERIAAEVYGDPADRHWELVEFDAGWLIKVPPDSGARYRGGSTRVVERATGRLMVFGSNVAQARILSDYERMARWGSVEREAGPR